MIALSGGSRVRVTCVLRAASRRGDTIRFRTNFRNTIYDTLCARPGWVETDRCVCDSAGSRPPLSTARCDLRRVCACSEVDWDLMWADVHWIRECMDHLRLEDHQVCNDGGCDGLRSRVTTALRVSLRVTVSLYISTSSLCACDWCVQRVNHFRNHLELTRKDLLVKNMKRMKKQLERADALDEAAKYSFLPTSFVLPAEYGASPCRCRCGIVVVSSSRCSRQ